MLAVLPKPSVFDQLKILILFGVEIFFKHFLKEFFALLDMFFFVRVLIPDASVLLIVLSFFFAFGSA
jgi:hypothetical protein